MKTSHQIIDDYILLESSNHTALNSASWYDVEHRWITDLAESTDYSKAQIAGVVSALSPGCRWESCKSWASNLILYDIQQARYGSHLRKALDILINSDTGIEAIGDFFTTAKTWNFYWNLIAPDNPDFITIDIHMFRYLDVTPDFKSKKVYTSSQDSIREAAQKLGLIPNQLQAILWEYQRSSSLA